jgi:hypothetical protein
MIRLSIATALLALVAGTVPSAAQYYDNYGHQRQYGTTYDSGRRTYDQGYGDQRYGQSYSRYGYKSYRRDRDYDEGRRYGYTRYGYGRRCEYNCY